EGTSGLCPPDRFAPPGTPCVDGDPCTDEDVCDAGGCTPGARVCDVTVSSPRAPIIRVECGIVRANVVGEGRASCEARAVFPPTSTAAAAASAEAACDSSESATRNRRRVVKGDQTVLNLKINRRARKALRRVRELGLQVCTKINLPDKKTVSVENSVTVVKP